MKYSLSLFFKELNTCICKLCLNKCKVYLSIWKFCFTFAETKFNTYEEK
jgi:hypothetical protein